MSYLYKSHKEYNCLLTQSGTSAPTATVLGTNTIGTIVWARTSTGTYTGTLTSAFPSGKCLLLTGISGVDGTDIVTARLKRTDNNTITLVMTADGVGRNDTWTDLSVKIEVHP